MSSPSLDDNPVADHVGARRRYMSELQKWTNAVARQQQETYAHFATLAPHVSGPRVPPDAGPSSGQQLHERHPPTEQRLDLPPLGNQFFIASTNSPSRDNRPGLYVYTIPPMWKRIAAEFIDFLILLVVKIFLTVFILESLDIINVERYDFSKFNKNLTDSKYAMQISVELLTLEIVHRIIVCCYETYWLVMKCATPGKRCMGIAVVRVVRVMHFEGRSEELVIAQPCTALNVKDAMFRALLKNVFIGILLPIFFVLIFFKYNRTGYDWLSNSLVVEYNRNVVVQANR